MGQARGIDHGHGSGPDHLEKAIRADEGGGILVVSRGTGDQDVVTGFAEELIGTLAADQDVTAGGTVL